MELRITTEEFERIKTDRDIRGVFEREDKIFFDRRYSAEGREKYGLSPRIADINLIGLDIVEIVIDDSVIETEGEV